MVTHQILACAANLAAIWEQTLRSPWKHISKIQSQVKMCLWWWTHATCLNWQGIWCRYMLIIASLLWLTSLPYFFFWHLITHFTYIFLKIWCFTALKNIMWFHAGIQPNFQPIWQHSLAAHCSLKQCAKEKWATCCQSHHRQACEVRQPEDEGMVDYI